MDQTTLEALEYPSVLKELSSLASTPMGREKAVGLTPLSVPEDIEQIFSEFIEAVSLIKEKGRFPVSGVADIRPLFAKAAPEGASFLPEEVMAVRDALYSARSLSALLSPSVRAGFPGLTARLLLLSDEAGLIKECEAVFDDKGAIKDNASHELRRIRGEMRSVRERARALLDLYIKDTRTKELLRDDIVTIRDDRFVLSIKAGSHAHLDGIVHGESGSGATFFIEPLPLIEINNRLALVRKEEREEEMRILREITGMILLRKEEILKDLEIIAAFDLLQAKALFSEATKAVAPAIRRGGPIRFIRARHPLLALKDAGGSGRPVVPVDIILKDDCRVLVISGANTGGKTVALKTMGLLTLMAASGIPVPAEEGSEAVVFNSIFADIGDRQDIIASLSTFSAHIKRLTEFFELASDGSLVLIDEIGAGTDPSEGGALALASLELFKERGALVAVTTHLNILKAHAQLDPLYQNASVEFDEDTLRPLYRLSYGIPGPSLGLSIAASLGIPAGLIERARGYITGKEGAFIESIKRLEEQKDEIERIRERSRVIEERMKAVVSKLKADRLEILRKVKEKANKAVEDAKEELKRTLDALKAERASGPAVRSKGAKKIDAVSLALKTKLGERPKAYTPALGDKVLIKDSKTKAVVIKIDDPGKKRAELLAGSLKVWVDFDRLEKRGGPDEYVPGRGGTGAGIGREAGSSINIIGMRVAEALPLVERFLDEAFAAGIERAEIIHGHGTGALSRAVAGLLKANGAVKSFHHGSQSEGGAGVTIVEFA